MVWMNPKALGGAAYQPTDVEHWANMVTHGVFVLPALYGAKNLLDSSRSEIEVYASIIYGISLVGLFAISTVFHIFFYSGQFMNVKEVLHRSDRAMIYIFIASSYTPWLLLKPMPLEAWSYHLRWGIWVLAIAGIAYQQLFHEKFKMIETLFYLIIGVLPSLAVIEMDDDAGLTELQLGGIFYIFGVVFFKMDGRIPLAHAIWHLFVVLGSFIHYFAVLNYLVGSSGKGANSINDIASFDNKEFCNAVADECAVS